MALLADPEKYHGYIIKSSGEVWNALVTMGYSPFSPRSRQHAYYILEASNSFAYGKIVGAVYEISRFKEITLKELLPSKKLRAMRAIKDYHVTTRP